MQRPCLVLASRLDNAYQTAQREAARYKDDPGTEKDQALWIISETIFELKQLEEKIRAD